MSNLQGTVLALANPATPVDLRQLFYVNSPLPGAIWNDAPANPLLANPNAFFPVDYDVNGFYADMDAVAALNAALKKKKWNTLLPRKVDFAKRGTSAIAVTTQLFDSVLRCVNLDVGQTVEGNRTDFGCFTSDIPAANATLGALFLYGEFPLLPQNATAAWDNVRTVATARFNLDWRAEASKLFNAV